MLINRNMQLDWFAAYGKLTKLTENGLKIKYFSKNGYLYNYRQTFFKPKNSNLR